MISKLVTNRIRRLLWSSFRVPTIVLLAVIGVIIYVIVKGDNCPTSDKHVGRASGPTNDLITMDSFRAQSTLEDVAERMTNRLAAIDNVCKRLRKDETFWNQTLQGEIYTTPDKSMVYCLVPKVGCTYWKQIFRFISKDFEGPYTSPFEIPKVYAHFARYNNTKYFETINSTVLREVASGYKFMFTRDPYTRLWSGYLDKLLLPEFWWWMGRSIIRSTRPRADILSERCGHDVTFEEYLRYLTNKLKKGQKVDTHFAPVHTLCNPCRIKFNVVGKLESFDTDSQLVVHDNNLEHVLGIYDAIVDKDLNEVQMHINFNFDVQDRLTKFGKNHDCYQQTDIARRLWRVFQMNGYLGDNLEFPDSVLGKLKTLKKTKRALFDILSRIRRTTLSSVLIEWKTQRRKHLENAYKHVSSDLIQAIKDTYAIDFELFGYEKYPDYLK